jgi:septal ring factor EnvC (AmiA/AmiB activator)
VEAVTSNLGAVIGDSYVLGNERSGATRKRIMLAASNDQLAARAQDQKRIAELERELSDSGTEAARLHQQDEETIAEMRQQIERLTSDLDAARLDVANLKTALQLEGLRERWSWVRIHKAGCTCVNCEGFRSLLGLADKPGVG